MKHAAARRKDAIIEELAGLGISQKRMSEMLGIAPPTISNICKRAGVRPPRERQGWQPQRAKSRARAETMAALYRDGQTLEQIGAAYGITRERVRQLMAKHTDVTARDGGGAVIAGRAARARTMSRDVKSLRLWGCSWDQYVALRAMKRPTRAYAYQKSNARRRGIGWEFTLLSWWTVWQASGKWEQRGRGHGYMMCRKGDTGPYSPENVYFATGAQNAFDGQCNSGRHDASIPLGVRLNASGTFTAVREGKALGTYPTRDLARAAYLRNEPLPGAVTRVRTGLPSGVRRNLRGRGKPFRAYFYVGSKQHHVGCFDTPEEAAAARAVAMQPMQRAA